MLKSNDVTFCALVYRWFVFFFIFFSCSVFVFVLVGNYLKQKYNSRREVCPEKFPSCKNKPDGINEHPIKRPAPISSAAYKRDLLGKTFANSTSFGELTPFLIIIHVYRRMQYLKPSIPLVISRLVMVQQEVTGTMTVRVMYTTGVRTVQPLRLNVQKITI